MAVTKAQWAAVAFRVKLFPNSAGLLSAARYEHQLTWSMDDEAFLSLMRSVPSLMA